ncbi:MFS transporter [Taibaiella sp. KBW10]|nr:MFS transporter [Taibaiella sp. KBW10]
MQRIFRIYTDSFKGLSIESWMLSAVMLLNRAGSMVLPFLGVYMVDHLKFSIADSGMVLSFFGVGAVVGSWLGGYITDKIGEFRIQAFSLFASVPMFCLLPLFTTPISLAAMVFVQSVTSEIFRPANSVAITKYAQPENITRAFSLNRMAVNLGFSIGPALGGLLSAISYNFLFISNAIAALVAGIAYVYFFRKRHLQFKVQKAAVKEVPVVRKKERSPYTDGRFILFCILCTVFSVCFFQLLSTLPLFYKDTAGLSRQEIGVLLGYSGIVVVLFEMLLVHIAEHKLSITQTMVIGTLLCAISYSMLGLDHHLIVLFISITLLSLGEILILPFMSTITAVRAGKHNKGSYMGMNGISVALAFIISPLLGSKIATVFGFDQLWIGTGILLVLTSIGFHFSINYLLDRKGKKAKQSNV